ncbi:MAG: hypothetical protein KKC75_04845 [Nanoarchaeota archaeon]|nr:hypothetical protein [Nanoarchaeota archaeon]
MMDTIRFRDIKFNFRNLKTYPTEGADLIRYFKAIKPFLEDYLKNDEILPKMQDKLLGSDYYVFVLITKDIVETPEGTLFGCVGALKRSENMVIDIRVVPDKDQKNFMLLKTLVHEIFHIFIETEKEVRRRTDEFLNTYLDSIKKIEGFNKIEKAVRLGV